MSSVHGHFVVCRPSLLRWYTAGEIRYEISGYKRKRIWVSVNGEYRIHVQGYHVYIHGLPLELDTLFVVKSSWWHPGQKDALWKVIEGVTGVSVDFLYDPECPGHKTRKQAIEYLGKIVVMEDSPSFVTAVEVLSHFIEKMRAQFPSVKDLPPILEYMAKAVGL